MNELLHPEYPFVEGDRVFIRNQDDSVDYAQIVYDVDSAAYILVYFTDKWFMTPLMDAKGEDAVDYLYQVGFDLLERVEDYDFNTLY